MSKTQKRNALPWYMHSIEKQLGKEEEVLLYCSLYMT
jgi:hypothetical protein